MKKLALSYGRAIFYVAVSAVAMAIAAHFLNSARLPFLSEDFLRWMRVATASLFAAATLGRCGWRIVTWGGESPAEKWDARAFRWLYIVGFALLVLSFLIRPV